MLDPHGTSWIILETVKRWLCIICIYRNGGTASQDLAGKEDLYDDSKRNFTNHRHQCAHSSLL